MASAHSQRLAAMYTAEQLAQMKAENTQVLNQGYGRARDDLVDQQINAHAAIDAGQSMALASLGQGQTSALSALGTGYDSAKQSYSDASALYQPYADAGSKALTAYENGVGLNGQSGNDAAVSAFRASPGYQYQVDQATDAVARKASSLGVLGSGNTMQAISDRAQNLADQDYSSYLDRLSGLSSQGLTATGQQANLTKGIGDLSAAQGNATANTDNLYATTEGNLYNTNGLANSAIYTGLGSSLASEEEQHANALANTNQVAATGSAQAVTSAAQASDAARNANDNLALGLLGLGLKAGTSLFSSFGG